MTVTHQGQDTPVPGVVVHHLHAATQTYIGSPALAILPDGSYVASNDHFGPGCDRNQTFVHVSDDRGRTWRPVAELVGQWWSSLFVHEGCLYLFGTTTEYGDCVIRRSGDGGHTWSTPDSPQTGLLREGRHHTAPGPVLHHDGRLWRAMEDAKAPGNWGEMFRAFMMHTPEGSDLLDADSWTATPPMGRDRTWLDNTFRGWLEGNAVVTPQGQVANLLRVDSQADGHEWAALIRVSTDGQTSTFEPSQDLFAFPGGSKKFTVRFDPVSERYVSLVNDVPDPRDTGRGLRARNTLSLVSSVDLRQWCRHSTVLHHRDDMRHGYQYVDWLFDGDDIALLSRSAHGMGEEAAHNHHDANYLTFHRIPRFRDVLNTDA